MLKKAAFAGVGIFLLASPFVASALSFTLSQLPPNPTIADWQNEIQQLQQIYLLLKQEVAAQGRAQSSAAFSANPDSGPAPLAVNFSAMVSTFGGNYSIDFGDGTTGSLQTFASLQACQPNTNCVYGSASHTYISAGTYTATLQQLLPPVNGGTPNIALRTIGTATITVVTASAMVLTASPVSGAAPLSVAFGGKAPGTSYTLDFGDSSPLSVSACSGGCTSLSVSANHTYTSAGTYTAKLTAQTGTVATTTIAVSGAISCTAPTHDMQIGDTDADTGGDVTRLQQYLAKDSNIYPEGLVTGFFGHATKRAVKRFQAKYGIPQTGVVGPRTRAAIAALCSGETPPSTNNGYSFTANPASGTAPVSVAFSAIAPDAGSDTTFVYAIDFGDGARADMSATSTSTGTISLNVAHTYTTGGTFTVKFLQDEELCGLSGYVYGCTRELDLAATTVTIQGPPAPAPAPTNQTSCTTPIGSLTFASGQSANGVYFPSVFFDGSNNATVWYVCNGGHWGGPYTLSLDGSLYDLHTGALIGPAPVHGAGSTNAKGTMTNDGTGGMTNCYAMTNAGGQINCGGK